MIRIVIENIILFLLPAAVYFGYMYLTRRDREGRAGILDDAPLIWLFVAGGVLVVVVLVAFGDTSGGKPGQAYQPPVLKDGKIIPGHSK
jgi:hypothetical protein